jgi:hypothetical protein
MAETDKFLSPALDLYNEVEKLLRETTRRANTLKTVSLVLSIITAGNLWLVLSDELPKITLWIGAIASTFVTLATVYLKSVEAPKRHARLIALHGKIAQLLAKVRSGKIDDQEFWETYKELEHAWVSSKEALNIDA